MDGASPVVDSELPVTHGDEAIEEESDIRDDVYSAEEMPLASKRTKEKSDGGGGGGGRGAAAEGTRIKERPELPGGAARRRGEEEKAVDVQREKGKKKHKGKRVDEDNRELDQENLECARKEIQVLNEKLETETRRAQLAEVLSQSHFASLSSYLAGLSRRASQRKSSHANPS